MQVLRPEPRPRRSDSVSLGWDPGTCIFTKCCWTFGFNWPSNIFQKGCRLSPLTPGPHYPLPLALASIQSRQSLSPWSTVGLTSPFMPRLVPPVPAQLSQLEAWRPTF